MSDSGYPDDIRQYDNDPRSPFYSPPKIICEHCEEEIEDEDDAYESGWKTLCKPCFDKEKKEDDENV